jgi:uncharacterized protein YraI
MFRKALFALGALATATLAGTSLAAAAGGGFVTSNLNLRAGPGFDYPVVATMRAGDGVTVYGCLSGWSWCDIDWRGNRGWAAGQYLQVMYQSHRRPITSYGVYLGLPFITFSLDSYWGNYYRHRHFYNQMPRFEGHKPPPGPPPSNMNPPPNKPPFNKPPHKFIPGGNNQPQMGPGGNNPPNGQKPKKPFFGNGQQGGNGPQGGPPKGTPQGGPKPPVAPACPPGQKLVNGACQ